MELELKQACLDAYETGGAYTLTQEETAETIVPDYCPDIARIIHTAGSVYIHSREVRDGRAEVSGTVRVSVLYTPEAEGGIRTLEFSLPFTVESDHRSLAGCVFLTADTETEFLESRMLNPRKIFTHCKLVTHMTGYRKAPLCFAADVTAEAALCVEKRQERQKAILLTHILEKDLSFTEELELSPGRDGAAELLSRRVCASVTETKLVGSKLIVKGLCTVTALYRTAAGACGSVTEELPFSQIMEAEGAAEDATVSLRLQVTGLDLQLDGGDPEGRRISAALYLHATALLWQEQEITLLSDLYSTAYDMTYEAAPLDLTTRYETLTRRQTVREVLEIGVVAESILSVSVSCGAVAVSREREGASLRAGATVRVLYLDEGGTALMAERCVDVGCRMELPEECQLTAWAECPEEAQGSLSERGIEVRFPVDFHALTAAHGKRSCVTSARLDPETPRDLSGAPSLVLRRLGEQGTAWELAKRYHTTIGDILAANQLETEESLPRETLLLIPRKWA